MTYSKYHTTADVPFPGADAVTLAVGMPEHAPQPPHRIKHVNDGNGPLCVDCRHCDDAGYPASVALWVCKHPSTFQYQDSSARYCGIARWLETGRYCDRFCGPKGEWFQDALDDDDGK